MMKTILKLMLFTVLSLCFAFAKAPTNKPNNQPEIVVNEFYTWYITCRDSEKIDCVDTLTTKQYVIKPLVDKIVNDTELDYDYFLGGNNIDEAKDVLPTIKVKRQSIEGNKSTVYLTFQRFKDSPAAKRLISLRKENGLWKISKVKYLNLE